MRRVVAGIVAVGACLLLLGSWPGAAQSPAPVKIGMLVPLTGVFTRNGREAVDGTRLYFDEIGWKVSGRPIELLVEDYEGKPDVGLTKARKLVERDGVHMLKGIVSSAVGLAVAGYAKDKKIPVIVSADFGVSSLTVPGPLLNPYIFRWSQSGTGPGQAAADWAYKNAGWRKVVLGDPLHGADRDAREQALRGGLGEEAPPGAVRQRRRRLRRGQGDRGVHQGCERQGRGQRRVHGGDAQARIRFAEGGREARPVPEHRAASVHQEGRARGQPAREHPGQDVFQRVSVLDVDAGGVPEVPGLG